MKKSLCILLVLAMVFTFAYADADVNAVYQGAAQFIQKSIPDPAVSSIGGEWAVIGLARSGADVSQDYFEKYYANLENLKNKVLKPTDLSLYGVQKDDWYTFMLKGERAMRVRDFSFINPKDIDTRKYFNFYFKIFFDSIYMEIIR